jgi:hypothetical protein
VPVPEERFKGRSSGGGGGEGEFELGKEDGGGGDEGCHCIDLLRSQLEACAGHDDDGVLAGVRVNNDGGGAGGSRGREQVAGVDAFATVGGAGEIAERIAAELANEADGSAGAGSGDGLVGALAAGAELERAAHEGFTPGWELVGAEGEVGDEAAHDRDPFGGHKNTSDSNVTPEVRGFRLAHRGLLGCSI